MINFESFQNFEIIKFYNKKKLAHIFMKKKKFPQKNKKK